jgi:tetratricopeptide (TPR) repeat protein
MYTARFFHYDPAPRWQERAYVAVQKALALDPDLPEAYVARAQLAWTLPNGFPHDAAIRDLQKAVDLDPSLVEARSMLGRVYMHVGLLDEALREWRRVLELEPSDPWVQVRLARAYLYQGRYAEALDQFEKIPDSMQDAEYAFALDRGGRAGEALAALRRLAAQHKPEERHVSSSEALLLARHGQRQGLERLLRDAQRRSLGFSESHHFEYEIGAVYAITGQPDKAMPWLERAVREGFPCYPLFAGDPDLAGLRGRPDFEDLLQRLRRRQDEFRALDRAWLASS